MQEQFAWCQKDISIEGIICWKNGLSSWLMDVLKRQSHRKIHAAHLNKIGVCSTWTKNLYKNLIVSFFLNIFVFALKRFTSCLKQSQSSVAFVHLHNDSLFLQRTNNTRRTYNISLFKLKNWIFSRKLPIFDIFLFVVVYFLVSHIVNQQLII